MATVDETRPSRRELADTGSLALRLAWQGSRGTIVAYVAANLAMAGATVASAWLMKLVLDQLFGNAGTAGLLLLSVLLAAVGMTVAATPQWIEYLRAEVGRRVGLIAQDRLYREVERFAGLARFEDPNFHDRLRLAQQGTQSASGLVDAGMNVVRSGATLVGFVGSLAVLSPVLTATVLLAAVPSLAAELALSRRRSELLMEIGSVERREMFYSGLLGNVEAAKEIRLFGTGSFLRGRMIEDRSTANTARARVDRREAAVQGGLGLAGAAIAGCGLVWAVLSARAGQISPGDVAMLVASVAGVQAALNGAIVGFAQGHHRLLLFAHFRAVVRAGPDLPVPARPRPVVPLRDGIELRDVWFRYSDRHPWILRGVNLRIPHGQAVALVGRNGAGKSTLVKLLCRFYDPTRGTIHWDGVDLRDMAPDQLRQRIAAVFQDYMAYDLSAAENVALGDLSALGDPGRIESAARRAGVHDVLAGLPAGYRTLLSRTFFSQSDKDDPQTGVVLSGGQWQRVALARAFIRDKPDFMVLDEPSAGLDAEAEYEIHHALSSYRAGRTSLLISHRLGAVRVADLIFVLADGRVIEQGRHDDLLAVEGEYAHLFLRQAENYQAELTTLPAQSR